MTSRSKWTKSQYLEENDSDGESDSDWDGDWDSEMPVIIEPSGDQQEDKDWPWIRAIAHTHRR